MLTHIVLMKLTDFDDAPKAVELLEGLLGRVPELRTLSVAVDTLRTQYAYDLALVTTHDDADGLRAYQSHPAHAEVISWLGPKLAARAVVDY
jgi:Stress responsive A/B Barrel Domain